MQALISLDSVLEAGWWIATGLALLAALTPTQQDDKILGRAKNLLARLTGRKANE
tara:strand:+ start:257 stop:421 length:165 start_codon:yes stop_codon:yes gene_type:complete